MIKTCAEHSCEILINYLQTTTQNKTFWEDEIIGARQYSCEVIYVCRCHRWHTVTSYTQQFGSDAVVEE
jgi:hypothetical protein